MKTGRQFVIDAVIFDHQQQKVLLQKRSPYRKLFPNQWDLIGGHMMINETESQCLAREIMEETHMTLTKIHTMLHQFNWKEQNNVVNKVYLVTAEGQPILEHGKSVALHWLSQEEVTALFTQQQLSEDIYTALKQAFLRY